MPRFHRHAAPATNTTVLQQQTYATQPATIIAQPITAPVYMQQTMGYPAGGPLVAQGGYVQQPILTKGVVSTTGITTQMSSTTLVGGKQTIVKPAIIEETVRTDTFIQVQPIVHREIDQQRIHHVEQHITERAAPSTGGTVKLAPIVQETVRTNIIEEVQPVIHREVATRSVERIEEHLTERIAAPVVHTSGAALGAGQATSTIARPAIIDERIRTDRLVQIQPIVHREIDQPRIHHVEQHITERAAPSTGGTVKLAPIVQETIINNLIEEVQPVIHRERAVQQVQVVQEHLAERIAAPVVHTTGASLGGQANASLVKPALIDERVRTDRLVEIQPIVHREIEQPRIHHVEQHITERAAPSTGGTVKLAPIVQETVLTNVIEEVQPVIHRERAVQQVQRVEEHLTERIAAPAVHTTGASLGGQRGAATVVKPALIDQRMRTDRVVEIQPVVHREITQPRIHHVEQHITERSAASMAGTVKLAPIVQETVRTNVVEEVQPVIHREVATRSVERVEEHLTERVAAPAIHTTGVSLNGQATSSIVKPALIDQRVRTDRVIEVQPVVHREITQPRVHHVEQHITERAAPAMGGTVKLAPIVQQTVRTNVIEEVQPVIHREIATRSIERVEEHLTERIAAPAIHTHAVQSSTTVQTAPLLTQGAALPLQQPILTQGLPLQKAPLTQGTAPLAYVPAGGPISANANLARPL